jgi:quinol monooxygenase YgiN
MRNIFLGVALLLSTVALAQGPPPQPPPLPGPANTVAYVDILPGSRAQAIDAFRKYRDASRGEAGFGGVDVFEQQRRGAYFVIIETWASAAALDAHAKAASTTALMTAVNQLAIGGYDQRPYGGLTVAAARTTNPQAVYLVTHVDTIPAPGSDPPGLLKALAEKSRTEGGNLRFDVLQHAMRRNHFTIIEAWENPAALDAHVAATHTRQFRREILPLSGSPIDERLFRAVE